MTATEGRPSGEIRDALRDIVDPCSAATGSDLDIVEMGLVESVEVEDDEVIVEMRLTTPACHMVRTLSTKSRNASARCLASNPSRSRLTTV
ncbi:MAG: iron-sulfur cluster assembly protein [Halobacteriales archaeon]|nr:iron-sulfur cluster assembly protein [Halobacteriales archaeon]